jgi:hypothetical protein
MADIKTDEGAGDAKELANIVAGVPKGFPDAVPTLKEVLTALIVSTHSDLTKLEIEEKYFRHAKGAGVKLFGKDAGTEAREAQMGKLLEIAVAKVREKKGYLGWLCEQWESLH